MGLDMKTRQKLTEETAKRYCQAEKKEKGKILDEFTATTGYNRKYAIHILRNTARIKVTRFNNCGRKSVQLTAKAPRKKRVYVKRYGGDDPGLFHIQGQILAKHTNYFSKTCALSKNSYLCSPASPREFQRFKPGGVGEWLKPAVC